MGNSQSLPANKLLRLLDNNRDALVCLFDQGVVSVAGFATSVLIGRLAPTELGVYYIGLSLVLFARGFQQQLISVPYTIYHHRRSDSKMPTYRGSCLLQEAGFLAIAQIYIVVQIMMAWGGWISAEVVPSLVALLAFMPIILMREVVRHYCFTHSKNVSVLAIDMGVSVLQVVALLGLGYLGALTGASAWIAIGISCSLTIVFWYVKSGPAIKFIKDNVIDDLKLNWMFGKWAVAGQFVGSLPFYILPWLLLDAAGSEGTGFFAACMTLVGIANIFNTGMANFLTPRAARVYVDEGTTGLKRVLIRMYLIFFVAVGAFALMLSVFGEWLAVNLFSSAYAGLQMPLMLLAIAKLFDGFAHTASSGLFAMERIKANFWIDVVLMWVTIIAAALLIYPYEVVGAAWTALIGSTIGASLRTLLVAHFLGKEPTGALND